MNHKFRGTVSSGGVAAAQAREALRHPGRARLDTAAANVNAASGVNFGPPPSIGELLEAGRSQAHVDAGWFSLETLHLMQRDLKQRAAASLLARDLGAYDKIIAAASAARFTANLLERQRARESGELS
jgi:hypothetical protein